MWNKWFTDLPMSVMDGLSLAAIMLAVVLVLHLVGKLVEHRKQRRSALNDPPLRRNNGGFIGVDVNPCLAGRQAPTQRNNRRVYFQARSGRRVPAIVERRGGCCVIRVRQWNGLPVGQPFTRPAGQIFYR